MPRFQALLFLLWLSLPSFCLADDIKRFESHFGYSIDYPASYATEHRSGTDINLVYFRVAQANTRLNPRLSFYVRTSAATEPLAAVKEHQEYLRSNFVVKRMTSPRETLIGDALFHRFTYRSEEENGLPTMCVCYIHLDPESGNAIEARVTSATKGGFKYARAMEKVVRSFRMVSPSGTG